MASSPYMYPINVLWPFPHICTQQMYGQFPIHVPMYYGHFPIHVPNKCSMASSLYLYPQNVLWSVPYTCTQKSIMVSSLDMYPTSVLSLFIIVLYKALNTHTSLLNHVMKAKLNICSLTKTTPASWDAKQVNTGWSLQMWVNSFCSAFHISV